MNAEALVTTDQVNTNAFNLHHPHDLLGRGKLHVAIEANDASLVHRIVHRTPASLKDRDTFHMTPFLLAASWGDLGIFKFLLDNGARCDDIDLFGRDALVTASESGSVEIVKLLVPTRQDPNLAHATLQLYTALHAAAASGHIEIVKHLLAHEADVFARVAAFGETASELAAKRGHSAIRALLRAAETDIRIKIPALNFDDNCYAGLPNTQGLNDDSFASSSNATSSISIAPEARTEAEMSGSSLRRQSAQQHFRSKYEDLIMVTPVKHTSSLFCLSSRSFKVEIN